MNKQSEENWTPYKMKKELAAKIAIVSALITLVSFGYKFTIGILATSLVMIIAAVPTLFVFICKAVFAKNMNQTRAQKVKGYFIMMIAAMSFSAIFILFSVLKVGGIDITNKNRFEGWIGIVFIFFIIALFALSIINLNKAMNKNDILQIGLKEITFISALADAVMIQEFLYRVILKYAKIPFLSTVNRIFPLAIGVLMVLVSITMVKRYIDYKKEIDH